MKKLHKSSENVPSAFPGKSLLAYFEPELVYFTKKAGYLALAISKPRIWPEQAVKCFLCAANSVSSRKPSTNRGEKVWAIILKNLSEKKDLALVKAFYLKVSEDVRRPEDAQM